MPTEVIKIDPQNPQADIIVKAADYIRAGKLVAIPTETVYGLAADLNNAEAIKRLYAVKKRPADKPFTVCISRKEALEDLAVEILPLAYRLAEKFWPGPLTLVLKSKNGGTVGLRMPNNKVALHVIEESRIHIVLPSANISENTPPNSAQDVLKDLDGLIDLVLDSGKTQLGIESTVVDVSCAPYKILRQGVIKDEEIEKAAGIKRVLFVCTGNSCRSVMAQGLLEKALKDRKRNDIEVLSAGTSVPFSIGPTQETLALLAKENVNISGYRSRLVDNMLLKSTDLILAMEAVHEKRVLEIAPSVRNRLYLLKEFAKISDNNLDVPDPIGKGMDFYNDTFYKIKEAVEKIAGIL